MITYIGVGFLMLGMILFLFAAVGDLSQGLLPSLGVATFGMGIILSYVGLKSDRKEGTEISRDEEIFPQPLSQVQWQTERVSNHERVVNGNKAFGFVLMSLGAFVLTVSGVFGLFIGSWPLFLLGSALALSGLLLWTR